MVHKPAQQHLGEYQANPQTHPTPTGIRNSGGQKTVLQEACQVILMHTQVRGPQLSITKMYFYPNKSWRYIKGEQHQKGRGPRMNAEVTESGYHPVLLKSILKAYHLKVKIITYFTSEVEMKILKITIIYGSPTIWQALCSL